MDIKEFIGGTVKELDAHKLELLKERLVGEYLSFVFVDEKKVSQDVFSEKVADYFEKTKFLVAFTKKPRYI